VERLKPHHYNFYCKANLGIGGQSFTNRTAALLNDLDFDWKDGMLNDKLIGKD